jgi:hypothetical protein
MSEQEINSFLNHKHQERARQRGAENKAKGLRYNGKPRVNAFRPELAPYLGDLKAYHRHYMRLIRTGTITRLLPHARQEMSSPVMPEQHHHDAETALSPEAPPA